MMATPRVRSWLIDTALPLWADVGVDRDGPGFVEQLTLQGRPADVSFKRVRVQARQIYCFAQAAERGWMDSALYTAERGVRLLIDRAWLGPDRGWATTISRAEEVLDPTPDLYDIAFILFALGWWFRASEDALVLRIAWATLDFLERYMRAPPGEGNVHRHGGRAPYLQNPHMHLTEVMIVLRDARAMSASPKSRTNLWGSAFGASTMPGRHAGRDVHGRLGAAPRPDWPLD